MVVQGISAEYAGLYTSNAPIRGDYNVTKSLEFATSNAPIAVTANLFNPAEGSDFTRAVLRTSNAYVLRDSLRQYTVLIISL